MAMGLAVAGFCSPRFSLGTATDLGCSWATGEQPAIAIARVHIANTLETSGFGMCENGGGVSRTERYIEPAPERHDGSHDPTAACALPLAWRLSGCSTEGVPVGREDCSRQRVGATIGIAYETAVSSMHLGSRKSPPECGS